MPQNTVIRTVARDFDFLEPAQDPNFARTDHIKLTLAGAGLFVSYLKGQIVAQKDDGTNEWAKRGTAGFTGPKRVMKYSTLIDDAGKMQLTESTTWLANIEHFEGSTDAYYQGYFKTADIVGLADAAALASCGKLIRGTLAAGIMQLIPGGDNDTVYVP